LSVSGEAHASGFTMPARRALASPDRFSAAPGALGVCEPTRDEGRRVVVCVLRMPAMLWHVTSGDIEMTTGSGDNMVERAESIAQAIADGMLRFS
jgi:hypothetical protein